jgi:hypothetical protein
MEACVRLAWAVLRCKEASSSSSSSICNTAEEYGRPALTAAATSAWDLTVDVTEQIARIYLPGNVFPQLADGGANNALYRLLLLNLAMCCLAVQDDTAEQCSRCSVLRVPQHHRLLLQELGVEWLEHSGTCKGLATPFVHFASVSLALTHHMNLAAAAARHIAGGSSSSSSRAMVVLSSSAAAAAAAGGGSAAAAGTARASSSSSSSCCSGVDEAALLTLLQAALLLAASPYAGWFYRMSVIVGSFVISLDGPAQEAAAAVMLQPFLKQLLPASLAADKADTAGNAATEAATNISVAAMPQVPQSAGQAGADDAAASVDALQETPHEDDLCLGCVTTTLHMLLGTGGRHKCCSCCGCKSAVWFCVALHVWKPPRLQCR